MFCRKYLEDCLNTQKVIRYFMEICRERWQKNMFLCNKIPQKCINKPSKILPIISLTSEL